MVIIKGGHLAKADKWYYQRKELEIVNSYKYLGFTLIMKLSFDSALEEFAGRAKGKVVEIMKIMLRLGSLDFSVFFKLFDAQVNFVSSRDGLAAAHFSVNEYLFACKSFCVFHPKPRTS